MRVKHRKTDSILNSKLDLCYLRYAPRILQHWHERVRFWNALGYWPDITRPKSFNEKICAKKLFDRSRLLVETTDKVRFRRYIEHVLGPNLADQLLVEVIQVFRSIEDLKSARMPKSGVIKPTHSSGRFVHFSENDPLDFQLLYDLATKWLSHLHGVRNHEWAYSQLEPGLMLETRLGQPWELPVDFKCFVFSGKCKLIQVDQGRLGEHRRLLYDTDWRLLDVAYHKPFGKPQARPHALNNMIAVAEKIARPFEFARIDFYHLDDRIKVGEITHYPEAGFGAFEPRSFDFYLGEIWDECNKAPLAF